MPIGGVPFDEWLALVEHELLLFAGIFFLLGALDELAVDILWLWLKLTGRARTARLSGRQTGSLSGRTAVFIPAWHEAQVIGATVSHALAVWPHAELRLYIGCYRNDDATVVAVTAAAGGDPRLRIVIHDRDGPSTKADCLNRLYRALRDDERRTGVRSRMIVLHDAEDMVDPAALALLDEAIEAAQLVQLPVLPVPVRGASWVSGHYMEEFAEAHGKSMVVRDALGAGIPSAGVGCAVSRDMLDRLEEMRGGEGPFAAECLTEDYELGLNVAILGGRQRFLRCRDAAGRLVATRACFPGQFNQAVRQKTRWVHGIAFQGWDRLGWDWRPSELWMRLRDRRGPLTALVLFVAYLVALLVGLRWLLAAAGIGPEFKLPPLLELLLVFNFVAFVWRAAWRFAFTAREYGWRQGLFAVARIPLANVIAIFAGRGAFLAYAKTLGGRAPKWEKTEHSVHPAVQARRNALA